MLNLLTRPETAPPAEIFHRPSSRQKEVAPPVSGNHLVLESISWQTYLRLLKTLDDRHLRITYDQGVLELMTLSANHERLKHLLGYLIGVLVEELGWDMAGFGSMTFKESRHRRGLEPDECYWIQNEQLVRGKEQIDLRRDPPPDLVLEIDITHSSLDRLAIYESLRVPEVWRWNNQQLSVRVLEGDGHYVVSPQSRTFPFLAIKDIEIFLQMRTDTSETELIRQFRRWVRQQINEEWRVA